MPTLRGEVTRPQVVVQPDLFPFSDPRVEELQRTSKLTPAKIRILRKDPTIALIRQLSVAPVLSSPWSIEATKDAPANAKELIEEQMLPVRLHILQKAFYGSIDFGFQPFEKVFTVNRRGFQVIKKYKPLLQDFTEILIFKRNGRFAGLRQNFLGHSSGLITQRLGSNSLETPISLRKSLVLNLEVEGTDWYGISVMDVVNKAQTEWDAVNDSANRFDKKIAGAHWIIHYPPGISEVSGVDTANDVVAKTILTGLQASGGVIVPNDIEGFVTELNGKDAPRAWRIELLSPGSNIQVTFIDRMKYLDALKVRAFGWPERAVLEGSHGTKAEAGEHADLALLNNEVKHQTIVQSLNWHVVNQLLRINYGEEAENTVFIKPAPIIDSRLGLLKEIYSRILQNPNTLTNEYNGLDKNALRDELGLPKDSEHEDEPIELTPTLPPSESNSDTEIE